MTSRPHIIDGKTIDPKRAVPREQSGKAESHLSTKRMYVSGIRDEHTEDMLEEYFRQFGGVDKVKNGLLHKNGLYAFSVILSSLHPLPSYASYQG